MNKKKELLSSMVERSYNELKEARVELFEAVENTLSIKEVYAASKAALIATGKVDGKNAEAREAQVESFLHIELKAVASAERKERQARYNYDIAQIGVDTARALIRIEEAFKGVEDE